jgi:putative chitinase
MIDRDTFFPAVRTSLFGGSLSQSQVDGMNYLLDVWETYFEEPNPRDGNKWLAYCLATVFHETAKTMQPIEEYGKGAGKPYGQPAGPYGQKYYGRGHVQLTWETNYKKGQERLEKYYNVVAELWPKPQLMLQNETSALVLYDGMSAGWFTGVGLPKYFNSTVEDPVNARRIVNGTDQAQTIAGYYWKFKPAIVTTTTPAPQPEPPAPETHPPIITITSDSPVFIKLGVNVAVLQAERAR